MPDSLLPIAMSQLGKNGTRYQNWAGIPGQDWCAAFVSWCANEAGYNMVNTNSIYTNPPSTFPDDSFPLYLAVGRGAEWFRLAGRLVPSKAYGGNYTPNPGDIIFFAWYGSGPYIPELWHTGIVKSVSNGMIYTVEGNNKGGVGIPLVREDEYVETDVDVCWFGIMNGTALTVSDYVIAAICGNFWRESTVNPGIWESLIPMPWDYVYDPNDPNKGGYGIGGFTNVRGPYGVDYRLKRVHDWLVDNGYPVDDGPAQLFYLVFIEKLWAASYGNPAFDEFLNSDSTDLLYLTDQWCRYWEGVPGDAMDIRYANAQNALAYIQAHKNDDPLQYRWIADNRFLTTAETENNIMCLYFWFMNYWTPGGGGGGGSGGKRKGRIPIWMMLRNPNLYF